MTLPRPAYYKEPLLFGKTALWADLYAFTMSQAFHKLNRHNTVTTFEAFVRKMPFKGGFMLTGGQNIIAEWLRDYWTFTQRSIEVLASKRVADLDNPGQTVPLFTPEFIEMIKNAKLEVTIDALEEGELAFPDEPIYVVRGPVWQCLLLEAAILNATNSQSLFATLAARIKAATNVQGFGMTEKAKESILLELGLRRAQSLGGLEATRAAAIGGIDGTSNVLAEEYYGIPSSGTMAHAFVMMYEDELDAMCEYAQTMGNNSVFLVDTYNSVDGVKKAIAACQKHGVRMKGIRLDSGDLAYLSKEARRLLDNAGFKDAKVFASNDLDEEEILRLKRKGAPIEGWGVGTSLVTAKAQPALGAVYKLTDRYHDDATMVMVDAYQKARQSGDETPHALGKFLRHVIKLGEAPQPGQLEKATIPGEKIILRTLLNDAARGLRYDGDILYPADKKLPYELLPAGGVAEAFLTEDIQSVPKDNANQVKTFPAGTQIRLPLKRMLDNGKFVWTLETVHDAKVRAKNTLALLASEHKELDDPHPYGVGITPDLADLRQKMIRDRRKPKLTV